jgi:hypothetical protein
MAVLLLVVEDMLLEKILVLPKVVQAVTAT